MNAARRAEIEATLAAVEVDLAILREPWVGGLRATYLWDAILRHVPALVAIVRELMPADDAVMVERDVLRRLAHDSSRIAGTEADVEAARRALAGTGRAP